MTDHTLLLNYLRNRGQKIKFSSGTIYYVIMNNTNPNWITYINTSTPFTVTIPKATIKLATKRNLLRRKIKKILETESKNLYNKNIFLQIYFWDKPDIKNIKNEIVPIIRSKI